MLINLLAFFDFVIFFDYHMSRYNQFLSRFKFGHKTCVTWGHPLTTYNKGIDFFLSGEELENSLTEKNYSEKLIKLNNLKLLSLTLNSWFSQIF